MGDVHRVHRIRRVARFNSVLTAPAVTLKLLRQVIRSGTGTDLVTEAYSLCMKFPVFVEWCWTWVITALS